MADDESLKQEFIKRLEEGLSWEQARQTINQRGKADGSDDFLPGDWANRWFDSWAKEEEKRKTALAISSDPKALKALQHLEYLMDNTEDERVSLTAASKLLDIRLRILGLDVKETKGSKKISDAINEWK